MSDKIRIGVVGLGTFVEIAHMPAYCDSPYKEFIEVGALCDLNEDRLKQQADTWNVSGRYNSLDEMLAREQLDAVSVVTPDHTHTPLVLKCLAAGVDVLVEKPLAMKVSECNQMLQAARKHGRRLLTDFHKREDPAHQEGQTRILRGDYGQLQMGWVWMQDSIEVPAGGFFKTNLAAKSSPVWFLGIHYFDLIRFMTGISPLSVRATGYKHVLPGMGVDTYDAVKADFVFANGASISFCVSWNLPESTPVTTRQGLYLQYSEGDIEINCSDRGFRELTKDKYRHVNPMFTRTTLAGKRGYGHESIGEILMEYRQLKLGDRDKLYREQEAARPSGLDGLYATLMGAAVEKSLELAELKQNGAVRIGTEVALNDILREELGSDADEFIINQQN